MYRCCNVAIGWEGCLANGGPQGPIYGQNRQRTASNRLLESHRKQSSNGLQQPSKIQRKARSVEALHNLAQSLQSAFQSSRSSLITDILSTQVVIQVLELLRECDREITALDLILQRLLPQ